MCIPTIALYHHGDIIESERGKTKEVYKMRTYYIYNLKTEEWIGEVKANSILEAERKALTELKIDEESQYIAAFTEKTNSGWL